MLNAQSSLDAYQTVIKSIQETPPNYAAASTALIAVSGRNNPQERERLNQTDKNGNTLYHHVLIRHKQYLESQYPKANEQGHLPLFNAISDSLEGLLALLQQLRVNFTANKKGDTPLHLAAKIGIPMLFTMMIDISMKEGLALDSKNKSGDTALHIACKGTLGNDGSEWVFKGFNELTLISFDKRYVTCCTLLLEHVPSCLNQLNEFGEAPLHIVMSTSRSPTLLSCLITHGADLTLCNRERETCLHLAVASERYMTQMTEKLLAFIVSKAASPALRGVLTMQNLEGNHFLQTLIEKVTPITGLEDKTELQTKVKIRNAQLALINDVLTRNLIDPNTTNRYHESMLHSTVQRLQLEECPALLRPGTNVDLQDIAGDTALHLAVQHYLDIEEGRSGIQEKKARKAAKRNAVNFIESLKHHARVDIANKAGVRVADRAETRKLRKLLRLGPQAGLSRVTQSQELLETLYYEQKILAQWMDSRQALPGRTETLARLAEQSAKFQVFCQQFFEKKVEAKLFLVASRLRDLKRLLADIINALENFKNSAVLSEHGSHLQPDRLLTLHNQYAALILEKCIIEGILLRFNQCLNSAVWNHLNTLLNREGLANSMQEWSKQFDGVLDYADQFHKDYHDWTTKIMKWLGHLGYANAVDYHAKLGLNTNSEQLKQLSHPVSSAELLFPISNMKALYPQAEQLFKMVKTFSSFDPGMVSFQGFLETNKNQCEALKTLHERIRWLIFIAQTPYLRLAQLIQKSALSENGLLKYLPMSTNQIIYAWRDKAVDGVSAIQRHHIDFARTVSSISSDANSAIYSFKSVDFDGAIRQSLKELAWVELFDAVFAGLNEKVRMLFSAAASNPEGPVDETQPDRVFFHALEMAQVKLHALNDAFNGPAHLIELDWVLLNLEMEETERHLKDAMDYLQSLPSLEEQIARLQQQADALQVQIDIAFDETQYDELERISTKLQQLRAETKSVPGHPVQEAYVMPDEVVVDELVSTVIPTMSMVKNLFQHSGFFDFIPEPVEIQNSDEANSVQASFPEPDLILLEELEVALHDSTYSEKNIAELQAFIDRKRQDIQQGKFLSATQRQDLETRKQQCLAKAKPVAQAFSPM